MVFEGELTEQEHDFVLTIGLNHLLTAGALPFHHLMEGEESTVKAEGGTTQ